MDKLDVLNRDTFVEQLVRLMNNLSDNKSSTCFAINGAWGCGKSFLLDIFEERLGEIQSENTSKDKYFVVRYNSWKYDYYEEPLVAIVSTMISIVEEKTKLFPSSQRREEILGILKSAGVVLLSMADEVVKNKIGVGFQKCVDIVLNGKQNGTADYEDKQEYDIYFHFNKVLELLNYLLQEIAQEYTVVFLENWIMEPFRKEYTKSTRSLLNYLMKIFFNLKILWRSACRPYSRTLIFVRRNSL